MAGALNFIKRVLIGAAKSHNEVHPLLVLRYCSPELITFSKDRVRSFVGNSKLSGILDAMVKEAERGCKYHLRQSFHAGRQHGRLSVAKSADRARGQFHPLSLCQRANTRC